MTLKGKMTHLVELSDDVYGNITRMDNTLEKMPERLQGMEAHLQTLYQQQSAAKAELGKPFPQAVKRAMDVVERLIFLEQDEIEKNKGIRIEKYLSVLTE
jgi:hypothetical protein